MQVLIDGIQVEFGNDVKVIWEDTPEDNKELHLTATSEGIILDVFDEDGECERTMSLDTEQLSEECI